MNIERYLRICAIPLAILVLFGCVPNVNDNPDSPRPIGTIDPVIEWHWTGSATLPDSNQVICSPIVINLDDDNADGLVDSKDIPDIVFSSFTGSSYSTGGVLRALSGDGSGELWSASSYSTNAAANPAAGDIDGDGLPEIIAVKGAVGGVSQILAFENNGAFKWESTNSFIVRSVSLADLDGDGVPEILAGSNVLEADGTLRWSSSYGYSQGTPCAVDLDLSGDMELVVGNAAYRADGIIFWGLSGLPNGQVAIGNFDQDNAPEIVLVSSSGNGGATSFYILEDSGTVKCGPIVCPGISGSFSGPPAIADINGDGSPEIIIANTTTLCAFESTGGLLWGVSIQDLGSGMTGATAFDFDGDGSREVAFADQYHFRLYDGNTGAVLFQLSVGNATMTEIPIVADVDTDGIAEIVLTANNYFDGSLQNGILVLGDPSWFPTRCVWNQHAYHIDNVGVLGMLPVMESHGWMTHNTFRCNEELE